MRQTCQKFDIFSFQSKFFSPKINSIFLKTIFWPEYSIRRTNLISSIQNLDHSILSSKIVTNFWWLSIKKTPPFGWSIYCKSLLTTSKFHDYNFTIARLNLPTHSHTLIVLFWENCRWIGLLHGPRTHHRVLKTNLTSKYTFWKVALSFF